MSHYANEIKEATCYMHEADFKEALIAVQKEVMHTAWMGFGWRSSVLGATSFEDVCKEFSIRILRVYGHYYKPIINDVYCSSFLMNFADIVAPHMTNGKIVVDNEYEIVTIKFKNGSVKIKRKEKCY